MFSKIMFANIRHLTNKKTTSKNSTNHKQMKNSIKNQSMVDDYDSMQIMEKNSDFGMDKNYFGHFSVDFIIYTLKLNICI